MPSAFPLRLQLHIMVKIATKSHVPELQLITQKATTLLLARSIFNLPLRAPVGLGSWAGEYQDSDRELKMLIDPQVAYFAHLLG